MKVPPPYGIATRYIADSNTAPLNPTSSSKLSPGHSRGPIHAMASSLRQMLPRRSILAAPSARAWTSQRCAFAQRRSYAIAAPDAADPKLQAIDLSKLQVQKTTSPIR